MKKNNIVSFIEKAREVHGDRYDYSQVNYINSKTNICIICPEHGEFWMTPQSHLRGSICPKCANLNRGSKKRWTKEEFIEKAREVHGDKYDYSKAIYKNANTKVEIICPEHGSFWQSPSTHVLRGQGCPKCAEPTKGLSTEQWIERFREAHGDKYDYSKFIYRGNLIKSIIICPEHGEFEKSPSKHLYQGCPKCSKEGISNKFSFEEKARKIHGDKYDYSKVDYHNGSTPVDIICPKHGEFSQIPINHLQGCGCPKCGNNISKPELEIIDFIKSKIKDDVIARERDILEGHEIDIYVPSKKIAIEYDGLRWHSEAFGKDEKYHLIKTQNCENKGIQLFHIFEDEWNEKETIVKSIISNHLGCYDRRIYARKCIIKEIDNEIATKFLNENHIQGACQSKIKIGLFLNDELVSLMTFGKPRKFIGNKNIEEDTYELIRFCNKINTLVIGGASKLFKYFVKKYNPKKIFTYADRRWSRGKLYDVLGFTHTHDSQPNYFYIQKNKRESRFSYRKSELIKKYGCPPEMSEHEFCLSKGWYRIYDCGNMCFEWNKIK